MFFITLAAYTRRHYAAAMLSLLLTLRMRYAMTIFCR